ncbi:transposable element Tcb2 transposase [Trichonephila clavipes]|nr:transposable element Tcb2 transposase [Trichonephila clavipes]
MARRNHLDDFTRGRMIRKLEEGRTDTSVAADFGINKSVVSRAWEAFQITGTAVRKVGGGHLNTTTAGDDQYTILQAIRDQHELASVISQQLCTATGRLTRGLLRPDASTKGAYWSTVLNAASRLKLTIDATIYSGAESTTTGQLSMESCPLYV